MSAEGFPPPSFDGEWSVEGPVLDAVADDFGHLVRQVPRAVVRPRTAADVVAAIRWAAGEGWKIAARGQGHALYGRSQVDGGIVVDMSTLAQIHEVDADRVVVDAGATWRSVLAASLPHGLTPPVLTNFLDLSVGGTLSAGGIGGTTHRYAMQSDNVLELEVVTGDGRRLTCSPYQWPDLFDAVRAGLSQFGIITRATLSLMPAPERVRRYVLAYRDLAGLAQDQRRILRDGRADHLQGAIRLGEAGWQYQLEMATFVGGPTLPTDGRVLADLADDREQAQIDELTYAEYVESFDALEGMLRSAGAWAGPHPWLLTFLPGSAAERIAGDVLDTLTPDDLGEYGQVIFYPISTGPIATPFLRLPAEDIVFPFNLVRFAPDERQAERMVTQNRTLYERILEAGGVLYPVSGFALGPADWRAHFGDLWQGFLSAKQQFDPRHSLTPGQGIFSD